MKLLTSLFKALSLTWLLLAFGCNNSSFQIGECVQKPDSMVVWKITELDKKTMTLTQEQNNQMPAMQTTGINGWIKTECL